MSQTAIRLKTRVLPGHRIEVTAPELIEGEHIELIVLSETVPTSAKTRTGYIPALDLLDALPSSTLTAADWERIELEIQEGKDSWE